MMMMVHQYTYGTELWSNSYPQGFFYDNGNGTLTQILYQLYLIIQVDILVGTDVTDTNTCYDDTVAQIFIYDQPYVEFEWNNTCAGEDVEFNNLSTATDTGLWYWNWTLRMIKQ